MVTSEDFNPIAEQGELDAPAGLFAMVTRRAELPSVAAGFQLVLIDKNGQPLSTGEQLSSGERRNGKARSWVKVDTREHVLEREVPFQEPSGSASFIATVTCGCAVANATEVAARGAEGVGGVVAGVLSKATTDIAAKLKPLGGHDPLMALNESRIAAERALHMKLPGKADGLHAGWLRIEVESVTVAFDTSTQQHHAELVKRSQKTQLFTADAERQKLETRHQIELRDEWREALAEHLATPGTRAIELALGDPSQENIAAVVNHLNAIEGKQQEQIYGVLSELIDKDYVHEPDELPKLMQTIVDAVNWKLPSLGQGEGAHTQIESAEDGASAGPEDGDESEHHEQEDRDEDGTDS